MKVTTTQLFGLRKKISERLGDTAEAHVYFGDELGRPRTLIAWARDRHGVVRELHVVIVDPAWESPHVESVTLSTLMS